MGKSVCQSSFAVCFEIFKIQPSNGWNSVYRRNWSADWSDLSVGALKSFSNLSFSLVCSGTDVELMPRNT